MIFEIKFRNEKYRKYLEHIVKMEDWTAVIGQQSSDLLKVLGEALLPILCPPPSWEIEFESKIPIRHSQIYGGIGHLLNYIDAPVLILNHLCREYEIHDILICENPIDRNIVQSAQFREFLKDYKGVFTPECYYEYDGKKSMNVNNIEPKNLFYSRATIHPFLEQQKRQLAERFDALQTNPLRFSSDDLRDKYKGIGE